MEIKFEKFGFYNVNTAYLQYLNTVDSEVQFTQEKDYEQKPFLGIIILVNKYNYFIPLTSGKRKHARWKNVGAAHYLVYEKVKKEELHKNDIFKPISNEYALKIFAALDLKKMIPIQTGLYQPIDFSSLSNRNYANLLEKEYLFCKSIQDGIISKVSSIYKEQKDSGRVYPMYCNFSKLEEACDKYIHPETNTQTR